MTNNMARMVFLRSREAAQLGQTTLLLLCPPIDRPAVIVLFRSQSLVFVQPRPPTPSLVAGAAAGRVDVYFLFQHLADRLLHRGLNLQFETE